MQQSELIKILISLALLTLACDTAIITRDSTLETSESDQTSNFIQARETYETDEGNCESIIDRGLPPGIYYLDEAFLTKMGWMWGKFEVYCDKAADVGWTVIQRRGPFRPHENFNRSWDDYARGFGDPKREFWFGNEWIHKLTSTFGPYELRVELEDWDNKTAWAQYSKFQVSSEESSYKLSASEYTGTAGDSFKFHDGLEFATYDKPDSENCTLYYDAGNWMNEDCFDANLNGVYHEINEGANATWHGVNWNWWRYPYSLKTAKMMIRSKRYRSPGLLEAIQMTDGHLASLLTGITPPPPLNYE